IVGVLLAQHPSATGAPLKRPRLTTLTADEKRTRREERRRRLECRPGPYKSAAVVDSSEDDDESSGGESD
ncbi:hypothetical protein JCM3770_002651, partial [Rhodotorula araucariae]